MAKELITLQINTQQMITLLVTGKVISETRVEKPGSKNSESISLKIPVQLKRCGIESKLVITHGDQPKAHPESVKALQIALIKALRWNQALLTDEALTLAALAERDNTDAGYINYLLILAYLAPDIMEAIASGNVPAHFSLEHLKQGFPLDWNEQRQRYFQA